MRAAMSELNYEINTRQSSIRLECLSIVGKATGNISIFCTEVDYLFSISVFQG